jgi:hypothetical protein
MVELTDRDIEAALVRGAEARAYEPRAASARFDAASGRIAVELTNGCAFVFPPQAAQGLQDATPTQLAQVEILGAGSGLHWENLDVDLSVPGLLAGVFGTRSWQASQAGRARSAAKAEAARENGRKGGRPKKKAS